MQHIITKYILVLWLFLCTFIGICESDVSYGTIQGQVTDRQNNPLIEYTISAVSQAANITYADKTDSGGQFALTNLPAGTWDVQVRHLSTLLIQREVSVTENAEVKADFVIEGTGVISGFLLDSVTKLPLSITGKFQVGHLTSDDRWVESTDQGEISNGYFEVKNLLSGRSILIAISVV